MRSTFFAAALAAVFFIAGFSLEPSIAAHHEKNEQKAVLVTGASTGIGRGLHGPSRPV